MQGPVDDQSRRGGGCRGRGNLFPDPCQRTCGRSVLGLGAGQGGGLQAVAGPDELTVQGCQLAFQARGFAFLLGQFLIRDQILGPQGAGVFQ